MTRLTAFDWSPLGAGPWGPPQPPHLSALPDRAALLVIGAGVTGLSCALAWVSAGREVVVVDRAFGNGAACRSGGIVVGDTLVGPAARFENCETELRQWVERHDVAGGLRWAGCMELDRDASLPASPIDWCDAGPVRLSRIVPGGTLDPAALVERLAAESVARGARLVDGVEVTGVSRTSRGVEVDSLKGRVTADRVLVATDATAVAGHFDPWPVRLVTVALETAPLGDEQLEELGWRGRQPFFTNDLPLLWGRLLPHGGMLAGRELIEVSPPGAPDLSGAIDAARERLIRRVRGLHPALAALDVVRAWAGPIARDHGGVPGLHPDPEIDGVFWAGGYGGHGLAQAFRLGAIAAIRLAGADAESTT